MKILQLEVTEIIQANLSVPCHQRDKTIKSNPIYTMTDTVKSNSTPVSRS